MVACDLRKSRATPDILPVEFVATDRNAVRVSIGLATGAVSGQVFLVFAQRAAAAFRAISLRRLLLSLSARARPPTAPPLVANSVRSCGDIAAIRALPPTFPPSLPRATAAGFFFLATEES